MLSVDLLKNHPEAIPIISDIWYEVLGKIWMKEIEIEEIKSLYYDELNHDMPVTYIALYNQIPVGSCTLTLNDGIRSDLGPWIADLVVDTKYQKLGIGKMLVDVVIKKSKEFGFERLYLFTFSPTLLPYYELLGWKKICMDEFKSHPVTVMEIVL